MSVSNRAFAHLSHAVRLAFALAALCVFTLPTAAREAITSFTSNVTLLEDASVDVTEVIDVVSEGNAIRRGITREIPTTAVNDDKTLLRHDLRVISVSRDGQDEAYSVEGMENGFKRIRIGDAEVFLNAGPHRYTIRYTMSRMARRFTDHDELYWNATGNYWDFPIERSIANVTLPDGAVISGLVGYTGRTGSRENAVTAVKTSNNTATFTARRSFDSGEGLTIAVSFQKGVLTEPTGLTGFLYYLSDHRGTILPAVAALLVLLYNLLAWNAVGRDPAKGTIIPLFHAPKGFSPALVHYIHEMGWKGGGWTAFTASIFDLGVKGLVTVENVAKSLTVKVTGKEPDEPLPPGERGLFDYFRAERSVTIGTATGVELNTKRGEFISAIEAESRSAYFRNNRIYSVVGFMLGFAMLGALVYFEVLDPVWLFVSFVVGVMIGIFSQLFAKVWTGSGLAKFIIIFWLGVAGFNLFGGIGDWATDWQINAAAVAAVSIVAINIVFAILMRAPTMQGRKVMDQIDGLLMYLNTAEKNRLNMTGEPPMTIKRFEAILPYAIALGVEKPWTKYFEAELARNAVADARGTTYMPMWYSGSNFSSTNLSNSIGTAASAMSAAMVSAQPVSSSSSGFSSGGGGGGGGSSGGGGGGGGGGGW